MVQQPTLSNNNLIPTIIVTGFLGAGKTSFLNHTIKNNPNTRFAIIENEFGEENIDGHLIVNTSSDILELNNGCLCCSLNDKLFDILFDLHLKKKDFDVLIIEATGIADPANIAQLFIVHPAVKESFILKNVIAIVDSEQIINQLNQTEEAIKQISFSDVIILNKPDLIDEVNLYNVKSIIQKINPTATLFTKENNVFPMIDFIQTSYAIKKPPIDKHTNCSHAIQTHEHNPKQIEHQHTDFTSITLRYMEAFDIQQLFHNLTVFLTFQAKDVYRVKGFIFDQTNQSYLLQSVGKRINIEPIKNDELELMNSVIVFIGKGIQHKSLDKLMRKSILN